MQLGQMTELEAVNLMLAAIGESPVNTLDGSGAADASVARTTLTNVSRLVQEIGWHFNTDRGVKLLPDASTKNIHLPANCLKADTVQSSQDVDVVQRGVRFYDRRNQTYEFTSPLFVDMVVFLQFEELPSAARHYVAMRASRQFQQGAVGSELLHKFTSQDEVRALTALKRADRQTSNPNMLKDNYAVARVLDRLL